jgi:hypothetical protein|tara:strand:- start:448 stop:1116 length:669 start_codon:yes stop_codon:yes gene_type:complete
MATRALIGYLDDSKKLTSTYNHYDGYPDYLGKILLNHFDDDTAAEGVAMKGYISNIDEDGTINSKYDEAADTEILDEEAFSAAMQIGGKVDEYGGDYGYIWFNKQWNTIKNNGIEGMAKQIVEELEESGMFMVDENKEENIMEAGYEAKWAQFLNEAEDMDFGVIKSFIAKDKNIDMDDFALEAYVESLKNSFRLDKDDYKDYEMDDYVEDFDNYVSDKMDS